MPTIIRNKNRKGIPTLGAINKLVFPRRHAIEEPFRNLLFGVICRYETEVMIAGR
jgi:hypothetical protein